MQRWTALGLAALLAACVATLFVAGTGPKGSKGPRPPVEAAADAGLDAAITDAGAAGPADAGEAPAHAEPEGSAAAPGPGNGGDIPVINSDAGVTLLDGTHAPALAADAPKTAVFGVILVQYKGAQGAPPNARSREAALQMAKDLAVEAKQDFKATVAKGDKGSMENAGRMPRGMLEPAPEYVLFSLAKEGVSDPVDTPRGYWIVRRIE